MNYSPYALFGLDMITIRTWTAALCMIAPLWAAAQSSNFYGLARKSDPSYEVYLATVDPTTGVVTNISPSSLSPFINLTGAALNPYNNTYHYNAADAMLSIDLSTGLMIDSVTAFDPISFSYFDNFRFNNADSSLYGLARTVEYDSITFETLNEMFLATFNTTTGEVTRISPSSIGEGFALSGSAIDPYMMVFYYSTGTDFVGLDMYTGGIYSSETMILPDDAVMFDNFTYSCVDTSLYGLMRSNYFSTYFDTLFMDSVEVLDSATIHLAKIDPNTGLVEVISPASIGMGGYSLGAGATIDPDTKVYYFNNGFELVGVSIETGLLVSQQLLTNDNGQYFDLMRIENNCIDAGPMRLDPTLSINESLLTQTGILYPNPAHDMVQFTYPVSISLMQVIAANGDIVQTLFPNTMQGAIDVTDLAPGIYMIHSSADGYVRADALVVLEK